MWERGAETCPWDTGKGPDSHLGELKGAEAMG